MRLDTPFNQLVEAAKVSTTDLALIASVTPRAAQLWRAGKQHPPQSLILLLMLIADEIVTPEWLALSIRRWEASKK